MSILLPAFAKSRTHRPRSGGRPRSLLGYVLSDPIEQVARASGGLLMGLATDPIQLVARGSRAIRNLPPPRPDPSVGYGMMGRAFGWLPADPPPPQSAAPAPRRMDYWTPIHPEWRGPRRNRTPAGAIGSFLSRSPAGRALLSFYGYGKSPTRNDVRAHRGVTAWAPQIDLGTGRTAAGPWWGPGSRSIFGRRRNASGRGSDSQGTGAAKGVGTVLVEKGRVYYVPDAAPRSPLAHHRRQFRRSGTRQRSGYIVSQANLSSPTRIPHVDDPHAPRP